jgi:hypothetical protein
VPRLIVALALGTCLAGCAETGDFGRPKPNLYNETLAPWAGTAAAMARGEPASMSLFTDDERELRNRAYNYLMPARPRVDFERQLADFSRSRIAPHPPVTQDPSLYYQALWLRADRSPLARYQALREDIENDRLLLGPFVAVACRVKEADRIRMQAMTKLPEVSEVVKQQAAARVDENTDLVSWVYFQADERFAGYRYALQNMVVETPDKDAIKVERVLTAYEADRTGLERCASKRVSVELAGPPSKRYTPRPEKPELPPK